MNLQTAIDEGFVYKIPPNKARAKNLKESAEEDLDIVKAIPLTTKSAKIIVRDLYECLRQTAESKGYERGYKFQNHESIQYFLNEILSLTKIAKEFNTLRKIRNGINYYGNSANIETAKECLVNVPIFMKAIIASRL